MKLYHTLLCLFMMTLAYTADSLISYEMYLFGLSYHGNRNVDWNEVNPGIGLGIAYEVQDTIPSEVVFSAGTYKDSYGDQAKFALVGPRFYIMGTKETFHTHVGFSMGYFKGSSFKGVGGMPVIGIGNEYVDLCFTGGLNTNDQPNNGTDDPKKNRGRETSVIAGFLKFRF